MWERLLHFHLKTISGDFVTKMNSHQRFASFEPDPKNAVFDVARKKNSTPSCTMTSGPRSNASGELVQITPKPSSSGGQTACDWEKCSNQIVEPRMFPLLQSLQEDCGHVPRFSTFTFHHES